jgi:hypothetical protein
MNVCIGLTLGITAKIVSPTRPLDVDATPDSLIGTFKSVLLAATKMYEPKHKEKAAYKSY